MTLSYARKAQDLLDQHIQRNTAYWVAFVLCAGFALRCALASVEPLNTDEGYYYHIGNQPTVFDTWKQSLVTVHPPLFFFAVRYWEMLGSSELFLRILPAALGVLAAFMAYQWLRLLPNQASAGWFALAFASFAPFPLALSIELRQYSFLLLLAFSALYLFERQRYYATALCCTAAVTTHYSAIFLLPYFPILLLARQYFGRRFDWRAICRACLPLLLPMAVFTALYFTHIRTFSADTLRDAKENWLTSGYFHRGAETTGSFVATHIRTVLESQYTYLSGRRLLFIGIILALGFRVTRDFAITLARYSGAALIMLMLASAAAVFGYYPLSPTRHSAILLAFTLPVFCLLISRLCRDRPSWSLGLSMILAAGLLWSDGSLGPLFHNTGRKADMARMATILRSVAGNGEVVFSDYSSAVLLNYYLEPRRSAADIITMPAGPFFDYRWSGVHVTSSSSVLWRRPAAFFQDLAALGKQRDLSHGVYVVNAGFSHPLATALELPGQPPVHWLLRNPGKPEVFWLLLGGGAQQAPAGARP
jgi:hypothetical protein